MKRLALLAPIAILAACASPQTPDAGTPTTAATGGANAMVYVSSAHRASDIASCLSGRLPHVHAAKNANSIDLTVGSPSNGSYFVALTPSGSGSIVKVVRGSGAEPDEAVMRFAVARCIV